jgi:protocatechuate 3,4-dioxygenase beta subunit
MNLLRKKNPMQLKNSAYFLLATLLLSLSPVQDAFAECKPTRIVRSFGYPGSGAIYHGNNLTQPAGKADKADGQILIIRGKVRDRNCVPITQALVEIWQLDPFGKRARFNDKTLADVKPVFTGSGRTHTGTDGEFTFITAIPGASKNRAPRIHIRIKPEKRRAFSTQLFLNNDERNKKDRGVRRLKASTRDGLSLTMSPTGGRSSSFYGDITLTLPSKAYRDGL